MTKQSSSTSRKGTAKPQTVAAGLSLDQRIALLEYLVTVVPSQALMGLSDNARIKIATALDAAGKTTHTSGATPPAPQAISAKSANTGTGTSTRAKTVSGKIQSAIDETQAQKTRLPKMPAWTIEETPLSGSRIVGSIPMDEKPVTVVVSRVTFECKSRQEQEKFATRLGGRFASRKERTVFSQYLQQIKAEGDTLSDGESAALTIDELLFLRDAEGVTTGGRYLRGDAADGVATPDVGALIIIDSELADEKVSAPKGSPKVGIPKSKKGSTHKKGSTRIEREDAELCDDELEYTRSSESAPLVKHGQVDFGWYLVGPEGRGYHAKGYQTTISVHHHRILLTLVERTAVDGVDPTFQDGGCSEQRLANEEERRKLITTLRKSENSETNPHASLMLGKVLYDEVLEAGGVLRRRVGGDRVKAYGATDSEWVLYAYDEEFESEVASRKDEDRVAPALDKKTRFVSAFDQDLPALYTSISLNGRSVMVCLRAQEMFTLAEPMGILERGLRCILSKEEEELIRTLEQSAGSNHIARNWLNVLKNAFSYTDSYGQTVYKLEETDVQALFGDNARTWRFFAMYTRDIEAPEMSSKGKSKTKGP